MLYLENRIWKIQNIKWFNQKIATMPIETSEEVIFKKVTTKRIVNGNIYELYKNPDP